MAKKKVTIEVPDQFSDELIQSLTNFPHVETVWIKDDGDWYFVSQEGTTAFSRAEILGQVEEVAPVEEKTDEEQE